nr:hypothetical protein DOP62_11725 [Synechococcus elongatus PCC 11801]
MNFHSPSARYHAASSAERNAAMAEFGLSLQLRLELAGNFVACEALRDLDCPSLQTALELWKAAQQQVCQADAEAIARAEALPQPDDSPQHATHRDRRHGAQTVWPQYRHAARRWQLPDPSQNPLLPA